MTFNFYCFFKNNFFLKIVFGVGLFFFIFGVHSSLAQTNPGQTKNEKVNVFLFYSQYCPHCHHEIEFLQQLSRINNKFVLIDFEVSENEKNRKLFEKLVKKEKLSGGVPVTVIGDEIFVGFDDAEGVGKKIAQKISKCYQEKCLDKTMGQLFEKDDYFLTNLSQKNTFLNFEKSSDEKEPNGPLEKEKSNPKQNQDEKRGEKDNRQNEIRVLGKSICLDDKSSLCFWAIFLGLVDGINPCMFSVLLFLLTYLLAIGSKKRALQAGFAFVATTFVLYFLFMMSIVRVIDVLEIAQKARLLIIIIATGMGLIMIKDFFQYGRWISLEIPQSLKPKIEKLSKRGTILSVILLAILSGIAEIPCTSGIPLAFISLLSLKEAPQWGYLILYNLFFIVPLILIVLGVAFAWVKLDDIEKWRKKSRKYMRLAAGILLLFLALALWKNWL